ncbi:19608_t:CDS:2 [Funneliformis geosporum]|nr:19608_t:CDS:2 [Funneliformis geosporum]
MSNVHKYFDRASEEWEIRDFLENCDMEPFKQKIDCYTKSLEEIANNEGGSREKRAQLLLNRYKKKASISAFWAFYVRNGNGNDRQIAKSWNNERSHSKVYLHQPTITCENISGFNGLISMNKNGIFASGSTISKRDREESDDDDFLPVPIRQQKRKKNLSLSKKDKKSDVSVKETKTIGEKEENVYNDVDDSFISNNGTIDLAESSDFLKDNPSSSSSIETARDSFKSASFDNKPHSEEGEIESIDIDQSEEEIRKLTQDEMDIRNKLLAILSARKEEDKKSGKDYTSSISLNNIIDLSNDKVSERVNKSLDERQIEWLNIVLKQKSWKQTDEFKEYVNQFTEDVCDRVNIPYMVRKSFVIPIESFNSFRHEGHDVAQRILIHFSERLEAPTRIENKSLDYERTYSIDTTIYIINRLFRMHQDVVELVWIELTTPHTKHHK